MTFVSKGEAIDQILASIKPLAKALDKVAADVEDVESETRKQADQMSQFLDDLKRACRNTNILRLLLITKKVSSQ